MLEYGNFDGNFGATVAPVFHSGDIASYPDRVMDSLLGSLTPAGVPLSTSISLDCDSWLVCP